MTARTNTKKSYELHADSREIKGRGLIKSLLQDKKIPAIVYGKNFENKAVSLKLADFEKVVKEARTSSIIDLIIDEKEHLDVLCHDIQTDYKGRIIHADFYKINAQEEVEADVHINFVGEPPAKKAGLTIMFQMDDIKVKCLPKYLLSEIDVDISKLEKPGDLIKISDIPFNKNIKVLENPEDIVIMVHEAEELNVEVNNIDQNLEAAKEAETKEKGEEAETKPEENKEENK
ncbi:MAG TPA: 50S ribosomal protein L25 [bacterium]|nr:50S ribosomal protein L25 [bacterium]HPO11016.1 50S ribosomal protein L25 [bacterium]HQL11889.1 50S ribosomal protein L25 [bacterium]